jgi:hypothetical protein
MSLESRKQKRELRKLDRKERKVAFEKLMEAIKAVQNIDISKQLEYKEKFNQVWPFIKPTIEFAIILKSTGDKFDLPAKQIIVLGDKMFGSDISDENAVEFLHKLVAIWEKIENVIEIVKTLADDKTDTVLDKIIEIGEWLFE